MGIKDEANKQAPKKKEEEEEKEKKRKKRVSQALNSPINYGERWISQCVMLQGIRMKNLTGGEESR